MHQSGVPVGGRAGRRTGPGRRWTPAVVMVVAAEAPAGVDDRRGRGDRLAQGRRAGRAEQGGMRLPVEHLDREALPFRPTWAAVAPSHPLPRTMTGRMRRQRDRCAMAKAALASVAPGFWSARGLVSLRSWQGSRSSSSIRSRCPDHPPDRPAWGRAGPRPCPGSGSGLPPLESLPAPASGQPVRLGFAGGCRIRTEVRSQEPQPSALGRLAGGRVGGRPPVRFVGAGRIEEGRGPA